MNKNNGKLDKYLIDTDIGDDIDDALAIALAAKKGAEIIGITTTYQNTQLRARLVKRLLSLLKKEEIPVYAGYGDSLRQKNDHEEIFCQYSDDLEKAEYAPLNREEGSLGESAVDFIIEMAETHGSELTIIGIGPLGNIARAIQKAPDSMKKVSRIVLMAGAFYEQFIEWNVLLDPEAAETVLSLPVPIYCIGTDVTLKCAVNDAEKAALLGGGFDEAGMFLSRLVEQWIWHTGRTPVLHDPLAVGYALSGGYVEFEEAIVAVETEGKFTRGLTLNLDTVNRHAPEQPGGKHIFIGKSVDAASFKHDFIQTVFGNKREENEV